MEVRGKYIQGIALSCEGEVFFLDPPSLYVCMYICICHDLVLKHDGTVVMTRRRFRVVTNQCVKAAGSDK